MTTDINTGNSPSHTAYHVRDANGKSYWNRIGVAWKHKDDNGFTAQLHCVPLDGTITFRIATE